uniref:Brachyury-like protein A n=1 Tax=Magallana gigas TaxID=29159 RepID=K1PNN0_MAGGI
MEAKLWYKFLEVGTEMIINRTGRRMFPYVEFSLRGLDPVGLYDVIFDIVPASNKCFKFLNNKWVPIGKKEHEFKTQPFKHPDSPRTGSEWMTRKISFEKVKLSNRPGSKSGIFTLHTQQKYLVRISLVKHEKGDEVSVVEYPIQATTFVAVTAYNNREVADLKINSNPYSKAFRYPVKRMKIQSFIPNQERTHATKNGAKKKSVIANIQNYQKVLQQNLPIDVSPINKKAKTSYVSSETKNEKGIQTDISMADIQSWYKFLASPLAMSFIEMNVPLPIFPHVNGNICEQASDNQNDEEMQNKIIKRDIAREERKMQHDARLETSDIKESDDVPKHIGRERTTEERLEQYKSRMESKSNHQFSSDNQKEEEMQNKNNSRERTTREERLEEYNARIEMWKRDKD